MLGVMLDCSRNAVMSVDVLKKFIVYLEKMGYDTLQLYTEDTYEVNDEPLFGYMRGRYTKAEIKEIDAFAKAHGIELIPCIQTLAHLEQIFHYPIYSAIRDKDDVLLVEDERTYRLIENMFKTCAECFTTRRIHIGMDEAHFMGLGKYLDLHGETNRFELFLRHLNKVCEMAEKYGFKPMIWSDMFFRLAFGGEYYKQDGRIPEEIRKKVPESVELVYWDYYHLEKEMYDSMIDAHLEFNRHVLFAGGAWKWLGFTALNQKSFDITSTGIKSCQEHGIDEIFITMWGDGGNECPAMALLPALVYSAECAKGNYDIEDSKKKFEEIFGESWDDFMLFDFPIETDENGKVTRRLHVGSRELLLNDCLCGRFDCMLSGTEQERIWYTDLAKKFADAKKRSKNFSYIFEHYQKLCEAIAVKCDLGYWTRKHYQAKDSAALKALLPRYDEAIERINSFVVAFRNLWYHDNKPHGFDVQELRLGGLLLRMKSAKERLTAYLDGAVSKIDELEETLIDYWTGEEPKGEIARWWSHLQIATPNKM